MSNLKTQFIEKCRKEFGELFGFDGSTTLLKNGNCQREINDFLQSKLSECWDMAGKQLINKLSDNSAKITGKDAKDNTVIYEGYFIFKDTSKQEDKTK